MNTKGNFSQEKNLIDLLSPNKDNKKTKLRKQKIEQIQNTFSKSTSELSKIEENLIIKSNESAKMIYSQFSAYGSERIEELKKQDSEMNLKITAFNYMKKNKDEGEKKKAALKNVYQEAISSFNSLAELTKKSYEKIDSIESSIVSLKKENAKILKENEEIKKQMTFMSSQFQKMIENDLTVKLRKNYEYFLFYFFNVPEEKKISNTTQSLKTFLTCLKNCFYSNRKKNKFMSANDVNIFSDKHIAFIEVGKAKEGEKLEQYHLDSSKLQKLIFYLWSRFDDYEDFKKYADESMKHYSQLSSGLHYSELIPLSEFSNGSSKFKEVYKLNLDLTEFCQDEQENPTTNQVYTN